MSTASQFDVVIIGAGVAGALIANVLAGRGVSVLLLEAGETGVDRAQMTQRWAGASAKRLGTPYLPSQPEKIPGPEQAALEADRNAPRDVYFDQQGPENYQSTYERRVGGSTWHWLGHTPRLLPNDFRMHSEYGVGVDWPVSYAELEPWYCAAEKELGVAGDHAEWQGVLGAFRSEQFPMPKVWSSWSDGVFSRALEGKQIHGATLAILNTPSARNSMAYDGRPPCAGNASCVPICPIGAKYDASVHVKKAISAQGAGRPAELREQCVVARLKADTDGQVHTVTYQRWDGTAGEVWGRIVVLCANAIESAKLLLMSNLANGSDQVGRNLMDHLQKAVLGTAPVPLYPFRGPPSTSGIEVFRDGAFRSSRAAFRMSVGNDGWSRIGAPQSDVVRLVQTQGLFGRELRRRLFDEVSRQVRMSCSVELLPNQNNRVQVSKQLDSFGMPRPQIAFATDDYTRGTFDTALEVMTGVFDAMRATVTTIDHTPTGYTGAGHIMGTTRMGVDPKSAVVDADCRSFEHRNLYVVGGSVFPTCGTANPTLTISALALRAAQHVLNTLPQLPASQQRGGA